VPHGNQSFTEHTICLVLTVVIVNKHSLMHAGKMRAVNNSAINRHTSDVELIT
jgi:hypothetical protein